LEQSETGAEPQTFVVKTIAGLEEVLAAEIEELGGKNVEVLTRAVSFEGDKRMLYKANYCLRTAQRILMPLYTFQMADEDDLYNQVTAYPWENYLTLQKTLAVDAVSSDSELTHTHYIAQRTKDAIVDRFRTLSNGRRPSVDTENPHVRINIHIRGSICDVSIDSSGASLHKRGYRVSNAEAPMSEVLAAGLIMLTSWKCDCDFIDPMCGSGTLLIEAAMIANNFPAGMYRKEFGFMHWPDFDQQLWDEVTKEALENQKEFDYQIIGSDISPKNLASAKANIKSARLHKDIKVSVSAFADVKPPEGKPGIVVVNPPYGERIRSNDIIGLYKSIGNTLKQEFAGYQAWVISSDQRALSFIGLRPSAKLPIFNGPLECRFEHFDLYRGSKRGRYMEGETGAEGKNEIREFTNRDDKPNWRSKEAPAGEFDSLDPKPREFKPRNDYSERKSSRFESKEGGKFENRGPHREGVSPQSEFKSKEFKPREFKPREERSEGGFTKREKPAFEKDSTLSDRPSRSDRFGKDVRPDRRKVEKVKLKPATRIEDRNEYLQSRQKVVENPETENISVPEKLVDTTQQRTPSKGNKFTEQRDYIIVRPRELRPRKARPTETAKENPKVKPVQKSEKPVSKTPKAPINYDDLED
jgi:putative N6-adenine-specific DNA methylase